MTIVAMMTTMVRTRIMTGVRRKPSSCLNALVVGWWSVGRWGEESGGGLQCSSGQYATLCHPVPWGGSSVNHIMPSYMSCIPPMEACASWSWSALQYSSTTLRERSQHKASFILPFRMDLVCYSHFQSLNIITFIQRIVHIVHY